MKRISTTLAAITFLLPAFAFAELKVGDAAPEFKAGTWVQGDAITELEKDKIYVVEFWATWCGPCIATIPHLDELHEKYKDKGVVFIGQNVWEKAEDKVPGFVKDMGEKMSYRVAMDLKKDAKDKGHMAEKWMDAAGQSGIPCAFLVGKEGKILWIGHPGELDSELLDQVVAGTFSPEKAAEMEAKKKKAQEKLEALGEKLNATAGAGKWDEALKLVTDAVKEAPDLSEQLSGAKLHFECQLAKSDEALATATEILKGDKGKAPGNVLNISSTLLYLLEKPSKETAGKCETWLQDAMSGLKDDAGQNKILRVLIGDVLARAQHLNGNKEAAVATLKKVMDSPGAAPMKELIAERLKGLEAGELPKEPLRPKRGDGK